MAAPLASWPQAQRGWQFASGVWALHSSLPAVSSLVHLAGSCRAFPKFSASTAPDMETLCGSVYAMPQCRTSTRMYGMLVCSFTIDAPLFCPACLRLPCLSALLQKLPVCFLGSSPSCSSAWRRSSEGPRFAEGCWRAWVVCLITCHCRHALQHPARTILGKYSGTASSSISTSSCFSVAAARTCTLHNLFASLQQSKSWICSSARHCLSRRAMRHTTTVHRYLIPPLLACGVEGFFKALTGHLALPQASFRSPRMQLHW